MLVVSSVGVVASHYRCYGIIALGGRCECIHLPPKAILLQQKQLLKLMKTAIFPLKIISMVNKCKQINATTISLCF